MQQIVANPQHLDVAKQQQDRIAWNARPQFSRRAISARRPHGMLRGVTEHLLSEPIDPSLQRLNR